MDEERVIMFPSPTQANTSRRHSKTMPGPKRNGQNSLTNCAKRAAGSGYSQGPCVSRTGHGNPTAMTAMEATPLCLNAHTKGGRWR